MTTSSNDSTAEQPKEKRSRTEETRDDAELGNDGDKHAVVPSNAVANAAAAAAAAAPSDYANLLKKIQNLSKQQEQDFQKLSKKQEQDHQELLHKFRKVECRLNRIAGVLDPAAEFALVETAAKLSIEGCFQGLANPSFYDKKAIDDICYGLATLCRDFLKYLMDGATAALKKDLFSWGHKKKIREEDKKVLLAAALRGLATYVAECDPSKVNAKGRNNLVHNGALISALYDSPEIGRLDDTKYDSRKFEVQTRVKVFRDASNGNAVESVEDAVGLLIRNLQKAKIDDELKKKLDPETETELCKFLSTLPQK